MNSKNLFSVRNFRLAVFFALALAGSNAGMAAEKFNELSAAEKKAGWILLFDGKTMSGWHGFQITKPAQGWKIEDNSLHHLAKQHKGDLISDAIFEDFELQWEWKVAPSANSGLKYFVSEERTAPLGHEYQMIDDDHYTKPLRGTAQGTGALYDLLPPGKNLQIRPVGEFNKSRILVRGLHVEHWLNGQKIVAYELGGEILKSAIARSKFKGVKGFGDKIKGHILLQDHGDEVWFRNLKLRPLAGE